VEEWEESASRRKETEIDLVELAKHIWSKRIFIAKVTGVFVVIGLLVALLSPKEYQTQATLMPEMQSSQSTAGNLLQKYGGLLGMSGSNLSGGQEGMIPPTLYPQIVQSLPFQLELLNEQVNFTRFDTTTTVYNFFDKVYTPSIFSYALKYTVGLPGKIVGLFKPEEPPKSLPKGFKTDTVYSVTKDQMKIVQNMQKRVTVSINDETGVLTLRAEMPDPQAAAVMGQKAINLLKEYVTNYRTRKAEQDLQFAQEQMQNARQRFVEAQNRLADFRDSNVNLTTAKAQTQEQRLQSEYDLAFNVYNNLAQQVEQAKLKVQEQTPVVSTLQPVQVPVDDTMSGSLILLAYMFAGLIFSVVYIVFDSLIGEKYYKQ